ncbi:MAG: cofactor-independent phosphoglycerate mutase [Planctomycetia bacterium]|nr:cofactor-independent phosphoglycerate mutase [Planctomycetia bacterium]
MTSDRMKYAILIPDGFADEPIDSLDGQTPMAWAKTPHLDALAASAVIGRTMNTPDGFVPGSDVATLCLLGYAPAEVYTGRAPLEAAAQGIEMGPDDWAFRCNLVTLGDGLMKSFTADHVSSREAAALLKTANEVVAPLWNELVGRYAVHADACRGTIEFLPGVSYRNLMLFRPERPGLLPFADLMTFPPHDYTDQKFNQALPANGESQLIRQLMLRLASVFLPSGVNKERVASGKLPATDAWLWGQGKRPGLVPFASRFNGVRGAMITAVDLLKGIARGIGWDSIPVPGITGYVDTDYAAKGRYAATALDKYDLVCVHVEATDEASHEGSLEKKIDALEAIDREIVPQLVKKLQTYDHWRLLVLPDHATPVRTKTHARGYVPFMAVGSDLTGTEPGQTFNESTAARSPLCFDQGPDLMPWFLQSSGE